ncbi:unnamed protein product [Amaranthus hypochondriacus]
MHPFTLNISLFLALIIFSPFSNGLITKLKGETDPIVLTCRKVTDFGFCVYTLRSDPRSAGASVYGYAQIALGILIPHAKGTSNYVQTLQKITPTKMKIVISTCIHFYGLATNNDIPMVVKSLNVKAYGNAKKGATSVLNDGQQCQYVIDKYPSSFWVRLIGMNDYMHDLSQLSRDLIGLLS